MKKIFPLIVVLITLSVVGILFIQMSWINNALKLKHEEFQRSVDNTLKSTRTTLHSKFITKAKVLLLKEEDQQFFLQNNFRVDGVFEKDEIKEVIEKHLKQNNIKQPFEFCVTNYFEFSILQSNGFRVEDIPTSKSIKLAPEDAIRARETLFLSIHEDKNAVIKEMLWMIIASVIFTTIIILAFFLTVRLYQ